MVKNKMTKIKFNSEITKLAKWQKKEIDKILRQADIKVLKLQKQYRIDNK